MKYNLSGEDDLKYFQVLCSEGSDLNCTGVQNNKAMFIWPPVQFHDFITSGGGNPTLDASRIK